MRTNIDIDDDLMREAMRASGATTRRVVVERGLLMLIQVRGQRAIRQLRGKVKWTGHLNASRLGRSGTDRQSCGDRRSPEVPETWSPTLNSATSLPTRAISPAK
jgi:Arc/MetJ family transcription regulator